MGGNLPEIIHHSLNAGEVSARYAARMDQNKYLAACETLKNFIPLVVGGARFREGTQFVTVTKTVTDHQEKRLVPFVASRTAAYVLEFGHEYIRIYRDGAPLFMSEAGELTTNEQFGLLNLASGMPWDEILPEAEEFPDDITSEDQLVLLGLIPIDLIGDIVTPYADTDLANLFWVQSIDVMYLLHKDYPVHKLSRVSETEFTLTEVNFNAPATIEEEPTGEDLGAGTLTPAATTGDGVNFTAENAVWLGSGLDSPHVGQIIVHGASRAQIVSVTSTTVVVADIIDDFPNTSPIPADEWRLVGGLNARLDVTNKRTQPGQIIRITAKELDDNDEMDTFRESDVGKYITLFGGMVEIIAFIDAANVRARILTTLEDIDVNNPEPTPAWTMEIPAWSEELGFPSSGCFFQERLYLCKGITINGSVIGDFENFAKGANADTAIARTLSDDDIDVITWIKGDKTLKVATGSGIYEITPTSQSGALTPTSFKVSPIDSNGGAHIMPLVVNPVLFYVDISGRELRELGFNFADDKFQSPQAFMFADHLMDGFFILEQCASSNPDHILHIVRNDGVLLGLVYERIQNVIGWYQYETDGEVKSACVIPRPSTGKDWLWVIVERDNGIFVEYFEPNHADTGREWDELKTDSAVVTTHDADFVVSGLGHLVGQTVKVIGDGQLFVDQVVMSSESFLGLAGEEALLGLDEDGIGEPDALQLLDLVGEYTDGWIALDPQVIVDRVEVGLPYEGVIVPTKAMVPAEAGGPLIAKSYARIGVRLRRTLGLEARAWRVKMNEPGDNELAGEQLIYRKPYHEMDAHVPLQQGTKCVVSLGNDPFARIEIKQRVPFPAEVLNVIGRLHVGDEWDCETYNDSEVFF